MAGLWTPEQQTKIDEAMNKWGTPPQGAPASNVPSAPYSPMPMAYSNAGNAINTPNMPATGYGGAVYGNSDWSTKQSIQDNDARLASDAGYRNSEYTRAQGVMGGLMKTNADVTDQQNYLAKIRGMMPQQQPQATPQPAAQPTAAPSSTPAPYGQMSPDAIKAEAQARIAKQIAERTRIATQTKAGYQTSYDRMRATTGEDRTLQDVAFQNNSNPFSGHTTFDKGMTNLQRERTDRQNQEDLQTRLGGVDGALGDWLNQTPDQQQQIINDLTKQERDYGLQVGTLTGNLQGYGRTLAGSAQDANYTGMYNGQQTMQAQNQAFNQAMASKDSNWNAYKDAVGMTGNLGSGPKSDWGQLPGQTGQASYPAQQQDIQNTAQYTGYYKGMPTMQKIMNDNTIKNMTADNARQASSEARTAGNAKVGQLLDIWSKQGTAPEGIPGVPAGTPLAGKPATSKPKQPDDYKTDTNFASDLAHIKGNPNEASKLDTNAQQFIDAYGYDGYLALRKAAGLD